MDIKELFGVGVSQDASFLHINKADLIDLTLSINNHPEQLLAAIILTAQSSFEGLLVDELGDLVVDELGDTIAYDNSSIYDLTVKLWRVIPTTKINRYFITHQYLLEQYAQTD